MHCKRVYLKSNLRKSGAIPRKALHPVINAYNPSRQPSFTEPTTAKATPSWSCTCPALAKARPLKPGMSPERVSGPVNGQPIHTRVCHVSMLSLNPRQECVHTQHTQAEGQHPPAPVEAQQPPSCPRRLQDMLLPGDACALRASLGAWHGLWICMHPCQSRREVQTHASIHTACAALACGCSDNANMPIHSRT